MLKKILLWSTLLLTNNNNVQTQPIFTNHKTYNINITKDIIKNFYDDKNINVIKNKKEENDVCINNNLYEITSEKEIEASWYWPWFHWKKTASWENFNMNDYTVAHKKLPFWTKLLLTNNEWDSVIAKVNDRGPYIKWRELDVSKQIATELKNILLKWSDKIKMHIIKDKN